MTRILTFDGEKGARRFELLRLALLSAGDGKGERTRETIRKEARLLNALDTVSEPSPTETDTEARALIAGSETIAAITVTLAQDDFELLTKYGDTTPWVPRAARDAVDLQDWLSAAEKVDA